jgi:hypothetical protein
MLGGKDRMKLRNYCPKCKRKLNVNEIAITKDNLLCKKHYVELIFGDKDE